MDVPGKPEDTNTKIIQELLWSDPSLEKGITSNSRGIGIKFGEDITCEFLKKSELKFLIRFLFFHLYFLFKQKCK